MEEVDDKEFEEVGTESEGIVDEKEFEEAAVDTGGTDVTTRQRSHVYTATSDTLFQEAAKDTRTHSLSLEWVFGMNPTLPAFSLQDQHQLVVLYAGAHVGIIYNHTSNSQHTLQGHRHNITCTCASDNRRWIATADQGPNNTVIVWDSYSGIPVNTLFNCHPKRGVTAMAFSSDAKHLVTLSAEEVQSVCIWDWTSQTEEPLWRVALTSKCGFQDCILFNPADSTQLLSRSNTNVIFYTRALGTLQYFAMKLKKYSRETPGRFKIPDTFMNPNMADMSLSQSVFHCRNPHVLTVTTAGNILVWDITPFLAADQSLHKEIFKIISLQKINITCIATTDSLIITGDTQGNITFYDEDFRYLMRYIDFKLDPIVSMSFSKECTKGFLGGCNLKTEPLVIRNIVVSTIRSFVHVNVQKGTAQILLYKDCEPLHAVTCHPQKPIVAIANEMGGLKLWDYNDKVLLYNKVFVTEKNIKCLTFDPRGLLLAVGTDTGTVHILDFSGQTETLQSLRYTQDSIHLISFSDDSMYLATADAGKAVTVFRWKKESSWALIGRYHSHYKPIKDLLFGLHPDSSRPRLLSLGMDRWLVEYDLENSTVNELLILSTERVEQSAVPMCMAWHPSTTSEQFLLVASDQYKIKLFNSTTKMCRKTVLGPTYGSPIKKVFILPVTEDVKANFRCMAFIIKDKVGLQILPLDGNPFKSNALVCHPAGVSAFACSHDGRFVFTAGESDCTVLSWETNLTALEAASTLGGADMLPFYSLLEGGREGKFYREMEDFFFYCQIHHQGIDAMERRQISTEIPLTEVPPLMRALAFFPTEREIEDMTNEVKYSKYAETGNYITKIDLEDFIKLYVNHRPAFGISSDEFAQAFRVLGDSDSDGQCVLQRHELLEFVRDRGESMTEEEMAECFTTLLGLDEEEEEEEEEGEEGKHFKREEFQSGSEDSEPTLECVIPEEISMETFTCDILGFPSSIAS